MTSDQIIAAAGWAGTLLAATAACYERFRNRKRDELHQVGEAKDELAKVLGADRDAWKARYEAQDGEFKSYRETAHGQAETAHGMVLKLTEENGRLKSQTDITPLIQHQAEQTEINAKILKSLDLVLTHLARLNRPRKTKA